MLVRPGSRDTPQGFDTFYRSESNACRNGSKSHTSDVRMTVAMGIPYANPKGSHKMSVSMPNKITSHDRHRTAKSAMHAIENHGGAIRTLTKQSMTSPILSVSWGIVELVIPLQFCGQCCSKNLSFRQVFMFDFEISCSHMFLVRLFCKIGAGLQPGIPLTSRDDVHVPQHIQVDRQMYIHLRIRARGR